MLVSFPSCHPASLQAACKLVAGNSFLISAANLIMVTLGNGSTRSQVIALNFSVKGQVPLIFNPLTAAAAASHLMLPCMSPPRSRQELADPSSARLGFASGIFLGKKTREGSLSPRVGPCRSMPWGWAPRALCVRRWRDVRQGAGITAIPRVPQSWHQLRILLSVFWGYFLQLLIKMHVFFLI